MFILPHLKGLLSGNLGSAAFKGAGLDLKFADNKSLVDSISGNSLVSFTRAGSAANAATFVGSDGLLQSAVTNIQLWSEQFDNASWGRTGILAFGSGSVVNAIAAPNGTITADFIVEDTSTGRHRLSPASQSVTNGLTYTCSFYAKSTNRNLFINCDSLFNARSAFNLQTGVVTIGTGSAVIQNIGDGWYRCSVTGTATETKSGAFYAQIQTGTTDANYTGDGTSGIYLWGAQLEQASTVGEYVPTTSVINSAPRFDHNPTTGESLGLLPEEARTNLIVQSENLGTTWTTTGLLAFGSGSTLNATVAPDGQTTADLVTENTSTSEHRIETTSISWVANTAYTLTMFAKANGRTRMDFFGVGGGNFTGGRNVSFNLSTGTVITTDGPIASIEARANGWYRIRMTLTTSATPSASSLFIRFLDNSNNFSYTGDGTSGIYLWGAQLEAGAFPTSYIPTTSATVTRAADVASITGSNFGTTRTNLLLRSEEFENASITKINATVTANAITAPNGTLTADKVVENTAASAAHIVANETSSVTSGLSYQLSVYCKAAERSWVFVLGSGAPFGTNGIYVNLSNGVTGSSVGSPGSVVVTPSGDGWYRISFSLTAGSSAAAGLQVRPATGNGGGVYTGDGTSGLFLWGAQLETGSAATPYIPSTTTFTSRASGASYFDAAGVLQWKPQNLLVRSEEFNDANWTKSNASISADTIASPTGSATADRLVEDNTNNSHFTRQNFTSVVGLVYTSSVYLKAAERTSAVFIHFDGSGFAGASVNLSTGAVTAPPVDLSITDISTTVNISAVGSGWYRVSAARTQLSTTTTQLRVSIQNGSNGSYLGNGTSGIYIWGAQLEQNAGSFSVPGEYAPTVATATGGARNSAFLPDSSGVFRSAGPLLLEEARTNVIQQSEAFSTGWVGSGYTTSTPAITSPSGQSGVYSVNEVSTAASQHYLAYLYSIPGSTPYTFSFFVKANQRNNISLRYYFADTNWVARVFDLSGSGALTQSSTGSAADVTSISQSIVSCPNGWYRISLTLTQPTTRSAYFSIDGCTTSTPTLDAGPGIQLYTGDVNKGYYLWGAQEEAGAYPSSYIPTTTSAVTRAADVSTSTATSVFESSWYNQTEGTVFAEFGPYGNGGATKNPGIVQIDSGSGVNTIRMFCGGSTSPVLGVDTSSVNQAYISSGTLTPSLTSKITGAYRVNDFARAVNGANLGTDSSGTVPTVSQMLIGTGSAGVTELNGTIKRLVYWGQRLPNTTLQSITL